MAGKKKIKQKEKKKVKGYVFLILILAIVSATVFAYYLLKIEDVHVFDFDVKVGDHVAFNLDGDKLHFGMIVPGGYGFRDIHIESDNRVKVVGKTINADYIEFDKNNFILEPEKKEFVRVTARVPRDMPYGLYEGKIILLFLKVS